MGFAHTGSASEPIPRPAIFSLRAAAALSGVLLAPAAAFPAAEAWAAADALATSPFVALSRLHDNRHHLSDVIFGSAVGVVVGHTVTMHTLKGHETWAVTPLPVPGGMGVMVSFSN